MVKRATYFVLGSFLVFLGILGFLLPIIPGFIPFILGVVLLSRSSKTIRGYILRLKSRFPRQYAKLQDIRQKIFSHK